MSSDGSERTERYFLQKGFPFRSVRNCPACNHLNRAVTTLCFKCFCTMYWLYFDPSCKTVMKATPGVEPSAVQEALKVDAEVREVIDEASRVALLKNATQEVNRDMRAYQESENITGRHLAMLSRELSRAQLADGEP